MKRLVIGCGFLGLPLSRRWQNESDLVFVSTRSQQRATEFSDSGLLPLLLDITKPATLKALGEQSFDTIVVAVGMDRSQYESVHQVYVEGLRNVLDNLCSEVGQLIYVSSTGVFGDFDGDWVDESSATNPQREGGRACLAAEQLLQES